MNGICFFIRVDRNFFKIQDIQEFVFHVGYNKHELLELFSDKQMYKK